MQVARIVQHLQTLDHLRSQENDRFYRKGAITELQELLHIGAQHLQDDAVEIPLNSFPEHLWEPGYKQVIAKVYLLSFLNLFIILASY